MPYQTLLQPKIASELWLNIHGRDFRLVGKTIRIGRSPDNDIVIDDKSISRYHALLTNLVDKIVIEDLKSRNGTEVNGGKIKRAELSDEAAIKIGDIKGVFYRKLKKASAKPSSQKVFNKFENQAKAVVARFQALDQKRKIAVSASAGIVLLLMLAFLGGSSEQPAPVSDAAVEAALAIETKAIDRNHFNSCVELEDLGSFRQAASCFKELPFTVEVRDALERVKTRQNELSEKRYAEGQQAYNNYYYDVAIQKWQEVLMIADDGSRFFTSALNDIRQAEERKRVQ